MAKNVNAKRFTVQLPPYHNKRLIWWAMGKGVTPAALGANIIQARIEANEDLIEKMVQDAAIDLGLTAEEVKRSWLERNNYNPGETE